MRRVLVAFGVFAVVVSVAAPVRTWTSRSGHTVEAEFIKREGDTVHLRTAAGKNVRIPYGKLSDADQAYVTASAATETSVSPPATSSPTGESPAVPSPEALLQEKILAPIQQHPGWVVAILVFNIPLCLLWGAMFFGTWAGFVECIKYSLVPDFWSFLQGELGEDIWAEFKLWLFSIWCLITVIAQFVVFVRYVVPHLG